MNIQRLFPAGLFLCMWATSFVGLLVFCVLIPRMPGVAASAIALAANYLSAWKLATSRRYRP